jgi:flagellin
MALSIQNNIASLVAQGNLNKSSSALNTSLQRLSSGLKINTGADGPAALVISNEQGAQIAGLQSAIDNTNQAVSLVQTGEGALSEVNDLLVQIRGLALSAANSAVNDPTALAADQAQIANALQTIDNIAANTQFGTKRLLDGSQAAQITYTSGASSLTSVTANGNTAPGTYNIKVTQQGLAAQLVGSNAFQAATNSVTSATGTAIQSTGGATATNNTTTGTYNVSITQEGLASVFQGGAFVGPTASNSGTLAITIDGVTSNVAVNSGDTISALITRINGTAGLDATAQNNNGAIEISKSTANGNGIAKIGGGDISVAFTSGGGGSDVTGVSTGAVSQHAVEAQAEISGGGLVSPITVQGSGNSISVTSGAAQGLTLNLLTAGSGPLNVGTTGPLVGTTASVTVAGDDSLTLNGTVISLNAQNAGSISGLVNTIKSFSGTTGVTASYNGSIVTLTSTKLGGGNFTYNEAQTGASNTSSVVGLTNGLVDFTQNGTVVGAQNAQDLQGQIFDANGNLLGGTITGSGAQGNDLVASGSNFGGANGLDIAVAFASAADIASVPAAAAGAYTASIGVANSLVFQIGANANQTASLSIQNTSSSFLGKNVAGLSSASTDSLSKINVTTTPGANDALKVIDAAIDDVSSLRGQLGAFQTNTLQATAANLQTTLTNTTAAQSVIRDTDFAAETANFTKAQVLVQAGTTVLTNANATAQLILNLLK